MSFGAHHKITGMISHRHPFYGDALYGEGDIVDLNDMHTVEQALAVDVDQALAVDIEQALAGEVFSPKKVVRPFIDGIATGFAVFVVSKAFQVDRKKALRVAFVLGGLNMAIGLASDYLFREVEAIKKVGGAT